MIPRRGDAWANGDMPLNEDAIHGYPTIMLIFQ